METVSSWAVTTTVFKLAGSNEVNNVKLNWMQRKDADLYKIYRDNNLIGEAKGNTYDDYNLMVNKTFTYHVEAFYNGQKVATSISQQATTFIPTGEQVVQYVKDAQKMGKTQKQITTELMRRGVTKEQVERIQEKYGEDC